MCLDTLASARELKRVRRLGPIIAWKVVRYKYNNANFHAKYQRDHLTNVAFPYAPAFESQKDKKQKHKLVTERNPKRRYPHGFHAWADRQAANDLFCTYVPAQYNNDTGQMIVPVLLQNIVAVGKQQGAIAYVARKMTILAEVPQKPVEQS